MKRGILVVCMFFVAVAVSGQVKWDVRAGANVSSFSKGEFDVRMGVKAGMGIEYAFSDLFAVRPGVFYSRKGAAEAGHKFTLNHKYIENLSYVELPVLVAFRFKMTEKFKLAINAGPYFAWQVGKKVVVNTRSVRTFDMGMEAGLDFLISSFVVGVGAQYGLTGLTGGDKAPHNINYSLTVGYRF